MVRPITPENYSINVMHHPAGAFGLVGGLIAAAELSAKGSGLTEAIKATGFDVAAHLRDATKIALEQDGGFAIKMIEGPARKPHAFLEDYKSVDSDSDAILDMYVGLAGYWANSHSTPYYPTLSVGVRVLDTHSKAVIYNAMFIYGPANVIPAGATRISPQTNFSKSNYDALLAQPDDLTGGLKYAIEKIAKALAQDLR